MEHFVVRMAAWQQKSGDRVSILSLQGEGPLQKVAESLGIPVVGLGGSGKISRIMKALAFFARFRPDIIHGHNQTSFQYALLGKKVSSGKVVVTAHGRGKADYREPEAEEWGRLDCVAAVSKAVAEEIRDLTSPGKLKVILNGVEFTSNLHTRAETRKTLGIEETCVVGIIVARIDHLKGHDTLLDACALLKKRGTNFTLLVVGDGLERANREYQALDLQLNGEDVRFLNFRTDVPDLLAASDFFLLPSLTEGLPLSVLEAMSHGLPIVATRVGGIPELVTDNRNGFLVPPKEPSLLAEAMEKLICDAPLRIKMGEANLLRTKTHFSFDSMMASYSQLYDQL